MLGNTSFSHHLAHRHFYLLEIELRFLHSHLQVEVFWLMNLQYTTSPEPAGQAPK